MLETGSRGKRMPQIIKPMMFESLLESKARSPSSPRPNHSLVIGEFSVDIHPPPKFILTSMVPHVCNFGTNDMARNCEVATRNWWNRVSGSISNEKVDAGGSQFRGGGGGLHGGRSLAFARVPRAGML